MTHAYAILPVSNAAFEEIRDKLVEAGYDAQFHDDGDGLVIDMHGIALRALDAPAPP